MTKILQSKINYLLKNILYFLVSIVKFFNSDLTLDFGYTGGIKSSNKKKGNKSHFSKFKKNYIFSENKKANLEINTQSVSNKKYLKFIE